MDAAEHLKSMAYHEAGHAVVAYLLVEGIRTIIATRIALAKCPSENWPSWLKKMAVIRALSLELSRVRPLTFGNVAQFAGA